MILKLDLINENANKDGKVIPTQRDLLAGIVAKHYAKTQPEMQVIVLNVHCAGEEPFVGTALFESMQQNGLIYGESPLGRDKALSRIQARLMPLSV